MLRIGLRTLRCLLWDQPATCNPLICSVVSHPVPSNPTQTQHQHHHQGSSSGPSRRLLPVHPRDVLRMGQGCSEVIHDLLSHLQVWSASGGQLEHALGAKITRFQDLYKKFLLVMRHGTEVRRRLGDWSWAAAVGGQEGW